MKSLGHGVRKEYIASGYGDDVQQKHFIESGRYVGGIYSSVVCP